MSKQKPNRAELEAEIQALRQQLEALERIPSAPAGGGDAPAPLLAGSAALGANLYRTLAESTPDSIYILTPDLRIAYLNPQAEQFLRRPAADVLGQRIGEIFPAYLLPTMEDTLYGVLASGQPAFTEDFFVLPPNHAAWLDNRLIPLIDEQGRVSAVLGISRDITDRRMADDILRQSEEHYRMLLESLPEPVVVHAGGIILFHNSAAASLFGAASTQELTGRQFLDLAHPASQASVLERIHTLMHERRPIPLREQTLLRLDGSCFYAEVQGIPIDYMGSPAAQIVLHDITARRQAEQEMKASRHMLRTVLDAVPQRIFWKDRDSRYLGCNIPFALDIGFSDPAQVAGLSDDDLPWRERAAALRQDDQEIVHTGIARLDYEESAVMLDGKLHWHHTSKMPLHDPEGGVIGILGTYEDITARKQAEERLRRYSAELAESSEEVKRFTYIVSHDLRAPLVNLKGFNQELRSSLEALEPALRAGMAALSPEQRQSLVAILEIDIPEAQRFIDASVTRMDRYINALLKLARLGRQEFYLERLDMRAIVEQALSTLAHPIEEKGVQVVLGPLPPVVADHLAMDQVIGNLLHNAVQYLDPDRPGRIEIRGEAFPENTRYTIQDNGRGIAPEFADRVFAPFRRASSPDIPGEGMGLAYVQTLVRRLGGRIGFESTPGQGAVFSFTIPNPEGEGNIE
jgi:PAS domain S-box-containing protein